MIMRGNSVTILLSDDLRAFVELQAAKAGYSDPGDYVSALLRELRDREERPRPSVDQAGVVAARAELDALRVGNRLDGLSIRDLIEEGRR
jgi:hypothetical protein